MERKLKICIQCQEKKYLFAKKMCLDCYKKNNPEKFQLKKNLGSSLKNITSQKKIEKVSKTQKKRLEKYNSLRIEYLNNHVICECCCKNKSTEIHHKAGRTGENLFKHFLAVCRTCHEFIENNPQWAKENNFSISRIKKE